MTCTLSGKPARPHPIHIDELPANVNLKRTVIVALGFLVVFFSFVRLWGFLFVCLT